MPDQPINYDPAVGWRWFSAPPIGEWRTANPQCAVLYHPWSGARRTAQAVGLDPFGLQLAPGDAPETEGQQGF